jgi:hypothetical protein
MLRVLLPGTPGAEPSRLPMAGRNALKALMWLKHGLVSNGVSPSFQEAP